MILKISAIKSISPRIKRFKNNIFLRGLTNKESHNKMVFFKNQIEK